jgi:hypothetical protein
MGGDFNAVLRIEENIGGIIMINPSMEAFKCFLEHNNLMETQIRNGAHTFSNKRSWEGCIK